MAGMVMMMMRDLSLKATKTTCIHGSVVPVSGVRGGSWLLFPFELPLKA